MWNKKVQICKERKLIGPSQAGGDLFDTAVGTPILGWVKRQLKWEDITVQRHSETLNYRKKPSAMLWIN